MADPVIPVTWGWYGDAIKWFIAIAAALLAFGFDRVKDGAELNLFWWIYLIGSAALGLSVLAGLFAYLQLLGAANILELRQANPDQQARLARYRGRLGTSYQLCVGLLMLGVVVSTVSWLGGVWPTAREPGGTPLSVERVDPGGTLWVVRRQGGATEILTATADGKLSWLPIGGPNTHHPR
jgi:hypothetical protein